MNKQDRTYDILLVTLSMFLGIMISIGFFNPKVASCHKPDIIEKVVYVYVSPEVNQNILPEEPKTKIPTHEEKVDKPKIKPNPTRGSGGKNNKEFTITAYDNSVESQGKWVNQTATGFSLKGHTLETAKCIAVDPKVIPLGSKVELIFDNNYEHLNGVYIARDTGGAIKGNKIDLFMGDGVSKQKVRDFGKRKVQVRILK